MGSLDSQAGYKLTLREAEVARIVVGCAYRVHRNTGAGLLESVYEACFCYELKREGLRFQRQLPIPVIYDELEFEESFRVDVLVEDLIVCELKSVLEISSIHRAQLTTYLKLTEKNVSFLINFNTDLMKHGLRRLITLPLFPPSLLLSPKTPLTNNHVRHFPPRFHGQRQKRRRPRLVAPTRFATR